MLKSNSRRLVPETIIPKYENLFVGYSNNIENRNVGSSGGVGTAILQYLLETGEVNAVIGVGFDQQDRTKCVYKIIEDVLQIRELAGSKYVYMKLQPLLDLIKKNREKRLAVVVEPCFVKIIKKLFPNCVYVFSFLCGYNITSEATDYLIKKAQVEKKDIRAIDYRGGEYPGGFTVHLKNGTSRYFAKEHWELVDLLFLDKTCGRCKVFISLDADIVLGDAWIKNLKKSTLLIANTTQGNELLSAMYKMHYLTLYDITREDVIKMHTHNLKFKTFGHSFIMKWVVRIFNNRVAQKIAPLSLFAFASRIRRALMVGIREIDLQPTTKYKI